MQRVCAQFIALDLADADFESELCSGSEARFWQRYTEAVLACEAVNARLHVVPSRNGPDLCIEDDGLKIWVEFICPEPTGIPREWLEQTLGCVVGYVDYPHTQMLLRWTAAIKEKSEKLLGRCGRLGYLAKGIVGADDCYVIAVNGRQLRGEFASLNGISQFPFAVEAAFAVGAYQLHIDRETLKSVRADYQHRPMVRKPSGAEVPAYTFLDERFAPVSAIWATDFDDCSVVGNPPTSRRRSQPVGGEPAARAAVAGAVGVRCNASRK